MFLHIVGAFAFVLARGVSAGVALRLRDEREIARVRALLDLSQVATQGMYVGLVLLLIGGITAAFMAGLWGRGWIWTAIAVLVFEIGFMYARGSRYYGEVRRAAGLEYFVPGRGRGAAMEPNPGELANLLGSPRASELAAVGTLGLLILVWLMVMKPF